MYSLNIDEKYSIVISLDFKNLGSYFKNEKINKKIVITDDNVSKYYLKDIINIIGEKNTLIYQIKSGEKSKNIEEVCKIYDIMINNNIDRKSVIISLGGGVVGDIAGFVASTYMRGIKIIQIPTTLLAQVDSSIGGKTGIDFLNKKNIIGTFYNPYLVYTNIKTLKTLPKEQFSNGMAEVIKYGYILDKDYLDFIFNNREKIKNYDKNTILNMIIKSCEIKASIVSIDEKEKGIREILNFGHSFGHSIETTSGFKILHGQAVAIGMIASMYISYLKGYIEKEVIEQAKYILKYFGIYNKNILNVDSIYKNMIYDKKNENKKIRLIILEEIGKAFSTDDINEKMIKDAIKYALEG